MATVAASRRDDRAGGGFPRRRCRKRAATHVAMTDPVAIVAASARMTVAGGGFRRDDRAGGDRAGGAGGGFRRDDRAVATVPVAAPAVTVVAICGGFRGGDRAVAGSVVVTVPVAGSVSDDRAGGGYPRRDDRAGRRPRWIPQGRPSGGAGGGYRGDDPWWRPCWWRFPWVAIVPAVASVVMTALVATGAAIATVTIARVPVASAAMAPTAVAFRRDDRAGGDRGGFVVTTSPAAIVRVPRDDNPAVSVASAARTAGGGFRRDDKPAVPRWLPS